MIETEKQEKINRMRKRITIANKIRLAFIFIAVTILVLIYFANKFYSGITWYENLIVKAYVFLTYDIFFMLIAVLVKIGLTVQYNKFIRSI